MYETGHALTVDLEGRWFKADERRSRWTLRATRQRQPVSSKAKPVAARSGLLTDPQAAVCVRLAQAGGRDSPQESQVRAQGTGMGTSMGRAGAEGQPVYAKLDTSLGCFLASQSSTWWRRASASRSTSSTSAADTTPARS